MERLPETRKNYEIYDFHTDVSYFEDPHLLIVRPTTNHGNHFVLAYKDQIYCPSLGIFKILDFSRHVWSEVHAFSVPFA